jgi:hypothetical protein
MLDRNAPGAFSITRLCGEKRCARPNGGRIHTFSVVGPGRAKSYGVTQMTDTSRTFHIEKYGF